MLVAPGCPGIGQRESASFQGAVGRKLLRRSSAKKELAERLHGWKAAEVSVQIAPGRQMSVTEKGRPAHGPASSEPLRLGYGMLTEQERGRSLRSTATLLV